SITPVLSVDSDRLAAVARWRSEYGPVTALTDAVRAARLPAALPLITGGSLELRARNGRTAPAQITAVLQHEGTGAAVEAVFRNVRPGQSTVTTSVRGCAVAPGCRLVRWQITIPVDRDGTPITLLDLRQRGPDAEIAGPAVLGDVSRWYPDVSGVALQLTAGRDGLTMVAPDPGEAAAGDKVYAADAARPLPVVLAGRPPEEWRFDDPVSARFGVQPAPVRVVGTAAVLPVVGAQGMLADLDTVRRYAADAEAGGDFQVWLAAGAPPSIVDKLRAAGLTVTADRSTAQRSAALAERGEVAGARFGLLTALAALLIAAAAVAVSATADREPFAEQLRALRVQGLTERAAVGAAYAGTLAPIAAALAGGVLTAVLAVRIAGVTAPRFTDGWRVVAAPAALGATPLAVAVLTAAVVLALTGWAAVRALTRRIRDGDR
ncbi:ABC transporter permease, partial [Actinoplanes sp. NPDC051633]